MSLEIQIQVFSMYFYDIRQWQSLYRHWLASEISKGNFYVRILPGLWPSGRQLPSWHFAP